MNISPKRLKEFKDIYRRDTGKEITDQEAYEAASTLVGLFEILWKCDVEDRKRKTRLKKEPEGFPVEDVRSCTVCRMHIDTTNGWYNEHGFMCFPCRDAVQEGTLPSFVCHHYDSFYRTWQLTDRFGWKTPTVRKMVRDGKLVARITSSNEYLFLKKENPGLIDPERKSAWRKSYDRNRAKVNDRLIREERRKMRAEWEAKKKKIRAGI